jgi:hypothetical protein
LTRWLVAAATAVALGSCATLDADQCRAGDWNQIGYRDGADGAGAEILAQHEKACAEYGIRPDAKVWRAGYDRGVLVYCTPENGLEAGIRNATYRGQCPANLEPAFLQRYGMGREVWKARSFIASIDRDIASITNELRRGDLTQAQRNTLVNRLQLQQASRINASNQASTLEAWARGVYLTPPPPVMYPPSFRP